jgi:DNA end-binding protein Ku
MIKKKAAEKPGAKAPEPRRRKKNPAAKDDLLEQLKASLAAIKN